MNSQYLQEVQGRFAFTLGILVLKTGKKTTKLWIRQMREKSTGKGESRVEELFPKQSVNLPPGNKMKEGAALKVITTFCMCMCACKCTQVQFYNDWSLL